MPDYAVGVQCPAVALLFFYSLRLAPFAVPPWHLARAARCRLVPIFQPQVLEVKGRRAAKINAVNKKPQFASVYARAAGRVGARVIRSNRFIKAGLHGARITLRSFGRTAHVLGLEVAGLFFMVFALVGGGAAVRAFRNYEVGKAGPGRIWLAASFSFLFAYFGVTSFLRSRSKS